MPSLAKDDEGLHDPDGLVKVELEIHEVTDRFD